MQENSVTAVPVSAVTASGLGTIGTSAGSTGPGVVGNTVNSGSNSNGSTGSTSNNGPGSGPITASTGSGSSTISPHGLSDIDQAQFEADKRAVYKHPLFSLLALLLEKCEQATQGYIPSSSSASSPNGSSNNGTSDGDSFSRDIQAFVQLLEKEKRPLLTNNSELDGLMIKALQVLRIHLLELEKVQELCRDFCTRYIACLRSKMQSENLLRSDYALEHNNNLSNSNSPINSPEQDLSGSAQGYYQNTDYLQGSDTSEYSNMQAKGGLLSCSSPCGPSIQTSNPQHSLPHPALQQQDQHSLHHHQQVPTSSAIQLPNSAIILENSTVEDLSHAGNPLPLAGGVGMPGLAGLSALHGDATGALLPTDLSAAAAAAAMAFQQQQYHLPTHPNADTMPLSSVRCPPAIALTSPLDIYAGQLSPCGSSDELDSELDSLGDGDSSSGKRQKRGILPKHATSVMRAWLFQHLVHPYPTEDEKRAIAAQTNLTLLQVNNWFINARRRILLPMLENASDNSGE
ncbi:homeobox protein PKNOX1-like isoform X1 [Anopheles funestus]|uniref:homeobox protein PKNOX1-like isoform X1 n=1 Tax=Anopheles funestus TaxID=62324 RepID=UPI0020C62FDD|nr:homeobox protein PKNOX1-like isoform X1 [Anopheles funestus]XP_049298075.1 homeobox protein PKNOX1-like isoform X1 [Anopheles funestus]